MLTRGRKRQHTLEVPRERRRLTYPSSQRRVQRAYLPPPPARVENFILCVSLAADTGASGYESLVYVVAHNFGASSVLSIDENVNLIRSCMLLFRFLVYFCPSPSLCAEMVCCFSGDTVEIRHLRRDCLLIRLEWQT